MMQVLHSLPTPEGTFSGSTEFQVVILSGGPGSRMSPLTTEIPKCLLPIANRPMISYQLEFLERVGFTEAIVVAQESAASELKTFVHEIYKGKVNLRWHFLPDYMGTAEALLSIKDQIKSDFMVMSGDVIVHEKFLHPMADQHRAEDATVTMLITRPHGSFADGESGSQSGASGGSSHSQAATSGVDTKNEYGLMDYIGLKHGRDARNRLLYFKSAADIENNMKISKKLLRREHNLTIHTDFMDAHFYIFSKSVLGLLEARQGRIHSIKGELIPYLVRCQFRKAFRKKESPIKRPLGKAYTMTSAMVDKTDKVRCFAYYMERGYCARANTNKSYVQMNLDVASRGACYIPLEPLVKNNYIHPAAVISAKTQVGSECVVGEGTKIGDRCSIKKSIIGKHCHIADGVKIINSVIMNHVTIMSGCAINGSVICNNVYMKEKCNIKDSQIGVSYNVPEKTEIKNEALSRETEGLGIDI